MTQRHNCEKKIVALIPAYNPDEQLPSIVNALSRSGKFFAIIVVNDGSDANVHFDHVQNIPGVTVLKHSVNSGKGAALKTGIKHVLCRYKSALGIVTADADGQHLPEDIICIADRLTKIPDRLILGVRSFTRAAPFQNRFGNSLSRILFRGIVGHCLQDTQSGLRGIPLSFAPKLLSIKTIGYDFELDMLIHTKGQGILIEQVPVTTIYKAENSSSHFNPFFDSLKIFLVFVKYILSGKKGYET